jgi:hypothetical protein
MAIQDTLTERLGPLPVWAWGAIAGGTIAAGRYVYGRVRGSSAPAESADVSGPAAVAAPASIAETSSLSGSFMAAGTYVPPADSSFVTSPAASTSPLYPTSNDEWVRMATPLVVERSSNSNVAVLDGLTKYVNGEALTAREAEIVELAIKAVGVPPYSVAPVTVKPAVTAPEMTPPPAVTVPPPAPAWTPPAFLAGARFVIADTGGAIYQLVPGGAEWIPSEDAFYRLGGGGTVNLTSGPYTYERNRGGIAPVPVPASVLATIPKVGATP